MTSGKCVRRVGCGGMEDLRTDCRTDEMGNESQFLTEESEGKDERGEKAEKAGRSV